MLWQRCGWGGRSTVGGGRSGCGVPRGGSTSSWAGWVGPVAASTVPPARPSPAVKGRKRLRVGRRSAAGTSLVRAAQFRQAAAASQLQHPERWESHASTDSAVPAAVPHAGWSGSSAPRQAALFTCGAPEAHAGTKQRDGSSSCTPFKAATLSLLQQSPGARRRDPSCAPGRTARPWAAPPATPPAAPAASGSPPRSLIR